MAGHEGDCVHLLTRNGVDWTSRLPLIFRAVAALAVRTCLIDGEAVCCDEDGVPVFNRAWPARRSPGLPSAFDLLELNGQSPRGNRGPQRMAEIIEVTG
jgi:bifunctional non-homologous end joining protein LigD